MRTGNNGFKALRLVILLVTIGVVSGFFFYKSKSTVISQPVQLSNPTESKSKVVYGNLAGSWTGPWTNSLGEHGNDTLVITENNGNLGTFRGLWSDNILVTGQWLNKTNFGFSGRTSTRLYQVQGIIQGNNLMLNYTATRLNASGTYTGEEKLTQTSK